MALCETETFDPRISSAHFLKRIFMFVPTETQQFAVQAKLNMALGKETFDRLFLGMEIDGVSDGVMKIWVRSEHCALDIQANHAGTIAVVAENILKKPIKSVLVLPKTFRDTGQTL
jgi:hypothetical protein